MRLMPKPQKGGPWIHPENGPPPEATMWERISGSASNIARRHQKGFKELGLTKSTWIVIAGALVGSAIGFETFSEDGFRGLIEYFGSLPNLSDIAPDGTAAASMAPTVPAPEVATPPAVETPQPAAAAPAAEAPKATIPETVKDYPLTDGDGITQGVMQLKEDWPKGVPMPTWLENIKTPQDVAEWARVNHFYTPEQVKDSIIMHQGDVLSVTKEGELILKNPDGTYNVITDSTGRAMPDPIPNRDFSDTVPTELPDARADQLLVQAAQINNPPVESFAGQNPWPVDSTEYRSWEAMRDFIMTHAPGDAWKTSEVTVSEYLQHLKVTK